MIKIPDEIAIRATIARGNVFYFIEESFKSPDPHYFVVLNKYPGNDEVLFLVCASSKVEKRKIFVSKRGIPEETLVILNSTHCGFLKRESVFDCNEIIKKSVDHIIEKLKCKNLKMISERINEEIMEKMVRGVLLSPKVEEAVKKILKAENT